MSKEQLQALQKATTPKLTKYIPTHPHPKQAAFLLLSYREAFFGGAAGGGKSEALLMAALQYVDMRGYNALILRRTFRDLNQPEAIMNRAIAWLRDTDAHWNANDKRFTFPSGATLTFGYLEKQYDHLQYQGAEFQYVAFDELTQFEEFQYTYLFSRLRRKAGMNVPLRMRAASNPGGPGHEWVKERFVGEGVPKNRIFIPSLVIDNPSVDQEEYIESLSLLDAVTRKQLLEGDWDATYSGGVFMREWLMNNLVDAPGVTQANPWKGRVRRWDMAATEVSEANKDPDYTAGALVGQTKDGVIYIMDMIRDRKRPKGVDDLMKGAARMDGREVAIRWEEEPGSSGKAVTHHITTQVLQGYNVAGVRSSGDKLTRAVPLASQLEQGNVKIVKGPWNKDFINEMVWFKGDNTGHDDQVDAVAGGYEDLVFGDDGPPEMFTAAVKGRKRRPERSRNSR